MSSTPKTAVGGTVDAFNFIRRFAFPSTSRVLLSYALGSLLFALVSLPLAGESLAQTLVFGGVAFVLSGVVGEVVNSALVLRSDRILDFRRLMGVELISMVPIGMSLLLSSIVGFLIGVPHLWMEGFLVGLSISFPIRFLTPMAMSSMSQWRRLFTGLPTPVLTTVSFLILLPYLSSGPNPIILQSVVLVISGLILSAIGVLLIIRRVEREGKREIHSSPMDLFRSFLDHWLRKTPVALEEGLLSLSTKGFIETKILSFVGKASKPEASIVVSNFHPGPYRDMGSGGLSSEMKQALEDSEGGIVQVPHGVSNHKLNIVSHQDINRLLSSAKTNYPSKYPIAMASRMLREQEGEAIVSGQAFGNVALLTITLAPEEMEDLPTEVSVEIEKEASRLDYEVLIIDAHNSLVAQTSITPLQAERIIAAAKRVLGRLKLLSQGPFSVGAGYDPLHSYGLRDGIGPGGLSVMAVKADSETVSYLTIDGNNMQRGLRAHILESVKKTGVNDAEVLTTDTHLVTGIVRSPLGYYPVGAALPTDLFIKQITDTVQKAAASMEASTAGFSKFSLELQVLGSETFNSITIFIGRIARQIGRSFVWLDVALFTLAIVILFVV